MPHPWIQRMTCRLQLHVGEVYLQIHFSHRPIQWQLSEKAPSPKESSTRRAPTRLRRIHRTVLRFLDRRRMLECSSVPNEELRFDPCIHSCPTTRPSFHASTQDGRKNQTGPNDS